MKIIFIIIILACPIILTAQKYRTDTLFFENKDYTAGKVIKIVPNKSVIFNGEGDVERIYSIEDIVTIKTKNYTKGPFDTICFKDKTNVIGQIIDIRNSSIRIISEGIDFSYKMKVITDIKREVNSVYPKPSTDSYKDITEKEINLRKYVKEVSKDNSDIFKDANKNTVKQKSEEITSYDYSSFLDDEGFSFFTGLSFGATIGYGNESITHLQMDIIGGYRFNHYLQLGIGVGFRYYMSEYFLDERFGDDFDYDDGYYEFNPYYIIPDALPLYADFRGILGSKYSFITPYWNLKIGGIVSEGFFYSGTLGLRFEGSDMYYLFGISYTNSIAGNKLEYSSESSQRNINTLGFSFSFGF